MGGFRKHGSKHDKPKRVKKNKTAKSDRIHGMQKGAKGIASQYLTRAQALKKLQVSLADFRRLCILKGIYPRDPKKKNHGNDKVYYHVKDIKYLQFEPLVQKFADLKVFLRKYKKAVGRKDLDKKQRLEGQKENYTLDHLVRERYPSFQDALRDLDDALSMLALFDTLPSMEKEKISAEIVQEATRLMHEFLLYVMQSKSLKKCFASIKGYYFQAEIGGETITWLVPHKFVQQIPDEVDFKVMCTFNEFYRTVMKFVNFKLYQEQGWSYPPRFNYKRSNAEVAALVFENKKSSAAEVAKEAEKKVVEAASIADFATVVGGEVVTDGKGIFEGMKVFLQREIPFHSLYFILQCGGAKVGWGNPGSPFKEDDVGITHQIIDRPEAQFEKRAGREYVQPQWVLDSFNEGRKLPIAPYGPEVMCPPHLSPFVNDAEEGYKPKQRIRLDELAEETGVEVVVENVDEVQKFQKELVAEFQGVKASQYIEEEQSKEEESEEEGSVVSKEKTKEEKDAEEELERRKAMMPKKHKRLYQRIEKGENKKKEAAEKLKNKAKKKKVNKV